MTNDLQHEQHEQHEQYEPLGRARVALLVFAVTMMIALLTWVAVRSLA